jgi:hypothetical protein
MNTGGSQSVTHSPSLGRFSRLPPEVRNIIYSLLLCSAHSVFVVPAMHTTFAFKLLERSATSQYDILNTLQTLSFVSRQIHREARTLFYSVNRFVVVAYGYEYLPVFVRWFEAIGEECRRVLRAVMFMGYMWYVPSPELTGRLQSFLGECTNARFVHLQLSLRHFCEAQLDEVTAYMNCVGPQSHNGPLPDIDIAPWATTIASLPEVRNVRIELVSSSDKTIERMNRAPGVWSPQMTGATWWPKVSKKD